MKNKPVSNEDFIVSLMSSYKVGALAQMVVFTAIDNYTRKVAKLTPTELKAEFPDNGLVHGRSWQAACVEIQDKLTERVNNR